MGLSLHCLCHLFYLILFLALISCCNVSALIILPDSINLYTCLSCSSVKYQLLLISILLISLLLFICPLILGLRGKNVVGSFLPFISLNVPVLNFFQNLTLLKLYCVFVTNDFNDVCSSSRLQHLLELF